MKMRVCYNCGAKYEGNFCPDCGAPRARPQKDRHTRRPSVLKSIWNFLWTLVLIAVVLTLLCIVLDFTPYAHNPEHATAYAIITSIRNMIPDDALTVYDNIKAQAIELWHDAVETFGAR